MSINSRKEEFITSLALSQVLKINQPVLLGKDALRKHLCLSRRNQLHEWVVKKAISNEHKAEQNFNKWLRQVVNAEANNNRSPRLPPPFAYLEGAKDFKSVVNKNLTHLRTLRSQYVLVYEHARLAGRSPDELERRKQKVNHFQFELVDA